MRNIKPQAYKALTFSWKNEIKLPSTKQAKEFNLHSVWADATSSACIFRKDLALYVDQWRKEIYELHFLKLLL